MRKDGGTPSRRDKHVTLVAISPPSVAWGRFVGGHQSGLAGCKPPPLFMRRASSCSTQGRRQGEPRGTSPRPSAPTYLPGPFSRHFGIFHEPKPVATGSKWATTTFLSIINGPRSFLEKRGFDPFLTHCWCQNGPFSRHFGIFHGQKRATTGSKRPKITSLSIPSGLGTAVGPHCAWAGRALRLHQVTTGTVVYVSSWASPRLGNHKKWGVAGGLGALGIRFGAT